MIDTALAGEWILDPSRSTVSLTCTSMGLVRVKGAFRQVTGEGRVTLGGQVGGTLTIVAASIDTKVAKRDKHLRSADFFDIEKYPDITCTVADIQLSGETATITGTLRVRDVERPLSFTAAALVRGDGEVQLDASVQVNRADYGITWNWLGMVSMNSTLTIHAVFTRATA
jgi:polyisoprenoid-binding protein YceI